MGAGNNQPSWAETDYHKFEKVAAMLPATVAAELLVLAAEKNPTLVAQSVEAARDSATAEVIQDLAPSAEAAQDLVAKDPQDHAADLIARAHLLHSMILTIAEILLEILKDLHSPNAELIREIAAKDLRHSATEDLREIATENLLEIAGLPAADQLREKLGNLRFKKIVNRF